MFLVFVTPIKMVLLPLLLKQRKISNTNKIGTTLDYSPSCREVFLNDEFGFILALACYVVVQGCKAIQTIPQAMLEAAVE